MAIQTTAHHAVQRNRHFVSLVVLMVLIIGGKLAFMGGDDGEELSPRRRNSVTVVRARPRAETRANNAHGEGHHHHGDGDGGRERKDHGAHSGDEHRGEQGAHESGSSRSRENRAFDTVGIKPEGHRGGGGHHGGGGSGGANGGTVGGGGGGAASGSHGGAVGGGGGTVLGGGGGGGGSAHGGGHRPGARGRGRGGGGAVNPLAPPAPCSTGLDCEPPPPLSDAARKAAKAGQPKRGQPGSKSYELNHLYHSDPTMVIGINTGGAACTRGLDCGRGICVKGKCVCTILHGGKEGRCNMALVIPTELRANLPPQLKNFHTYYSGGYILSKDGCDDMKDIIIHVPSRGPKKEPDTNLGPLTRDLLRMLPQYDLFGSVSGHSYATCAVVGSSGIMLNYEHGKEIDAHDMVMRFNSAPTRGYEGFVGSKTTYRIANSANFAFRERKEEIVLQHMRTASAVKMFVEAHAKYKEHNPGGPPLRLYGFHPEFVSWMASTFPFLATSGLTGTVIALQHCKSIHLYGFQVSARHGAIYHYYNKKDKAANEVRDDDEWVVVKTFVDMGLVSFRENCIVECHSSASKCRECVLNDKESLSSGRSRRRMLS